MTILPEMPKNESASDGGCACTPTSSNACGTDSGACCGGPAAPPASPHERPGYRLCRFVTDFMDTPAGSVPRVSATRSRADFWGTVGARTGITRDDYMVAPGLYAMGDPTPESPVFVTANYKLSFDALRRAIGGIDAWMLVLDTRGINVWCAAGKGTFSTAELVHRIEASGLSKVVAHRRLILPQLGATGVSAIEVKKQSGFSVVWGPIRAKDIPAFLKAGMRADAPMRQVTFRFFERFVLIPVELNHVVKPALIVIAAMFLLSGIGPGIFSFSGAMHRGIVMAFACLTGIVAGAVATPLLLPWLPGTAFALKGTVTGIAGSLLVIAMAGTSFLGAVAVIAGCTALSSFLAMNFTGSTPFTSPSGVEKEMRRAIPLQIIGAVICVAVWIGTAFIA